MPRTWLVTGSSRGLGREVVKAVAAHGDTVVATARDTAALADLVAINPDQIVPFALDLTNPLQIQAALEFAMMAFGRVDVLVNNAGFGRLTPFEQSDEADLRAQFEVNFFGAAALCRAVMPLMRTQGSGCIMNVSSIGGRLSTPGLAAYQAAKWAISGLSEVLAVELAQTGVQVIALEPGGIRTDWMSLAHADAPTILPDYESTVGATLSAQRSYIGNEDIDPARMARIIVDLADRNDLPAHLVIGSNALKRVEQAETARRADAERWRNVSAQADFVG